MSLLGALFLGAVQGLTEFLPISSSGHLAVFEHYIDVGGQNLAFDLLLHLGTLVPVLIVFRADLLRMLTDPLRGEGPMLQRDGTRWLLYVVIASVPTAIMGVLLKDYFETTLSGFYALSWQFAVTAIALQGTSRLPAGTRTIRDMTWKDALIIGVAQGIAILPAVSRSGSTIVTAVALKLDRDLAGRFSFVISVPAILGACLLELRHLVEDGGVDPGLLPAWTGGALVSLVVGWISLTFLLKVIRAGNFGVFGWYCWGMAAVCAAIGMQG